MKAIQISGVKKVEIIDQPAPTITSSDDVIVKVKAIGICGTDVHTYLDEHPFVKAPVVVGHEASGEVIACGDAVTKVQVGDWVAIDPVLGCGICRPCTTGRANACAKVSCRGVHVEGAMQEQFKIRERDVHKLPENVTDLAHGAVVEPFAIGAQACWRGQVSKGDIMVIFGAGPIGLSVMLNGHCLGAQSIIIDKKEDRLEHAMELGALAAFSADDPQLFDKIMALTDEEGPHVACDAVGHPAILRQCVDLLAPAGTLILLGMDGRPNDITELEIFRKEMTVVGSRMNSNMFPLVLERVAEGKLNLADMFSHCFAAENADEAFAMAVTQPAGFLKSVITL
ncbi:alcohol dehydrogenase catalytic domain-containing protein [Desulforhopalus sp. 52FAK]